MFKRLELGGKKFDQLLKGIVDVTKLVDPVGRVTLSRELDSGLALTRVACPIGVLCVIFEARPDAAVQIASLALKSGNAVILKGGSEALHSNKALVDAMRSALSGLAVPQDAIQLVSSRYVRGSRNMPLDCGVGQKSRIRACHPGLRCRSDQSH